ncbi:MAG TPA: ABC transporter permease, partial [Candidatus Mediterraneibacter stercoripullorum]|nr:ABC transporter permease [Candidatus Mediterraneibacter stercoripullorum]
LIMYYKQISEGYEDQDRFSILMKVGMSRREVKQSINSQVLTVFFLPLIMAGIHLVFAFPLISKLLVLLISTDEKLLMIVTAVCFVVFALFYMLVYAVTSREYFRIVSGKKESRG